MAIALVQTVTQVRVAGSGATSFNITVTSAASGNALTFLAAILDTNQTWTISSVADAGNTWTTREGECIITGQKARAVVSHAVNITGGTRTITLTLAGTGGSRYLTYGCLEFSGVATSAAEDTWDANSNIDVTSTDVSAGPITTTQAGDVLVGVGTVLSSDPTMNYASPTSWTNSYRENDAGLYQTVDAGYWLPAAVQTTYTAQWAHDNSINQGTGVVVALLEGSAVLRIGQTMSIGFHPGKNPTKARFYLSPQGFTAVPASTQKFRKTLSPFGSRTGSRQTHNS